MENFLLEETRSTPLVELNADTGVLRLYGPSFPENAFMFYNKIIEWVEAYESNPQPSTHVTIQLSYYNSSSFRCFQAIFKSLGNIREQGKEVKITWYLEDDEQESFANEENLEMISGIKFEMVENFEEDEN